MSLQVMGKRVLVFGLPGVGKNTVVKQAVETLGDSFRIVNYGNVLQDLVGQARDKYRREANLEEFLKSQSLAAEMIAKMDDNGKNLIITSHAVMWRESGFIPGFPEQVLKMISPNLLVLIISPPHEIIIRKLLDADKGERLDRDTLAYEITREQQNACKYICFAYSMMTGAPVKIIENTQGRLDDATAQLIQAINDVCGNQDDACGRQETLDKLEKGKQ